MDPTPVKSLHFEFLDLCFSSQRADCSENSVAVLKKLYD